MDEVFVRLQKNELEQRLNAFSRTQRTGMSFLDLSRVLYAFGSGSRSFLLDLSTAWVPIIALYVVEQDDDALPDSDMVARR
mgnify:CR=1 FL=1